MLRKTLQVRFVRIPDTSDRGGAAAVLVRGAVVRAGVPASRSAGYLDRKLVSAGLRPLATAGQNVRMALTAIVQQERNQSAQICQIGAIDDAS